MAINDEKMREAVEYTEIGRKNQYFIGSVRLILSVSISGQTLSLFFLESKKTQPTHRC